MDRRQAAIQQATELIAKYEGFRAQPYLCSAKVWTIGYGTTRYPDGVAVQRGDVAISEALAHKWLAGEVHRLFNLQAKNIRDWQIYHPLMQAALLSFGYNLGGNFAVATSGFNTIQKNLSERDWEALPLTLELYRSPGTKSEAGLLRRRKEEGDMWSAGLEGLLTGSVA